MNIFFITVAEMSQGELVKMIITLYMIRQNFDIFLIFSGNFKNIRKKTPNPFDLSRTFEDARTMQWNYFVLEPRTHLCQMFLRAILTPILFFCWLCLLMVSWFWFNSCQTRFHNIMKNCSDRETFYWPWITGPGLISKISNHHFFPNI